MSDEQLGAIVEDLEAGKAKARQLIESDDVETVMSGIDRIASTSTALLRVEKIGQDDEHHVDKQQLGEAGLALDAVKAIAGLSEPEKLAMIQRAGLGAMLPKRD